MIAMGATNLFDSETNPIEYGVKNFTVLPGFDPETKSNDMAIIFLDITRSNKTKVLETQSKKLPVGTTCYVTGWGTTSEEYSNTNIASVEVVIANASECAAVKGSICTRYLKDGTAGCAIDEGSPLICGGKVAGVAAKGLGCASEGLSHTFFTDVATNKKWIKEVMCLKSSDSYWRRLLCRFTGCLGLGKSLDKKEFD